MGVGALLIRVPWKQVITMLPSIVKTARSLMVRNQPAVSGTIHDSHQDLVMRVEQLEENERMQADLVKRMAENQQGLAEGLQFMAARINALIWLAAIALILALAAFIIVLVR
jgi:hypothetical protein